MALDTVIETNGLTRTFGSLTAVETLSLSIGRGEMFGIVGPDGSGKTTMIRMLCGILAPSAGSASVLGFDVVREADRIKREIGYLSQRFSLYGDLSVDENIEFFAEINGVTSFEKMRNELLDFTRLTPFRERMAEKLSGGMKQKLALACTLIHTPKIIFLDEPTTGVDPVSRRDFWRILQSLLKRGITIVMTTPYLDEAERCSRVAMMNRGSLLVVDTPDEVKKRMTGEIIEVVCENVRDAQSLLKQQREVLEVQAFGDRLNIVLHDPKEIAGIRKALSEGGIAVQSWRKVEPSLENVFISLITHSKIEEELT
ncbi:MAG TPA: ABC transporter ATP-binding protein [Bacteroidota bacterium]|jgi:ABC-2 type transport system ATP-binding protein